MDINVDQLLQLHDMGFSTEQIKTIMGFSDTKQEQVNVEVQQTEVQKEEPKPEVVEAPQIDYKKLAMEVALLNQRNDSVEPHIDTINQSKKDEEKPVKVEDVILGFLD